MKTNKTYSYFKRQIKQGRCKKDGIFFVFASRKISSITKFVLAVQSVGGSVVNRYSSSEKTPRQRYEVMYYVQVWIPDPVETTLDWLVE